MSQKTLPSGWSTAPIGMLCSLENGRAFRPTDWSSKGIPIVRIQNLNNPNAPFNFFDQEYSDRYHLNGGELLFAWSGTPGTSFGAHIWYGKEAVLNQPIFRVDFDKSLIDKRFFRYAINQKLGELIDVAHGGVGLRHVTKGKFEKTVVVIPPLNEQKRIADKLDTLLARVGACRERLDRVPQIFKHFRQAVLAAATSGALTEKWRNSNGFEAEWTIVELGDVAVDFSYGSSAKSAREGITPVLRMGNIQNGQIDWDNLVFTSDPSEIEKYRLHAGDVLFNRTNSPELVGKTAVFKGEREAIYAGYLIRIRCGNNLLPDYLNYCLNSPAGRDYCWQVKSDGVSQSNINAKKLAAFPINLPSLDEQHEVIRRVEILFAFAERLESRYIPGREQVDQLIPSLLDKAFNGELTVEWREQNPDLISGENSAEALLARITTEKAEADRATIIHRKSTKTKTGKNMKPKMIIPVAEALKAAGTPLTAQALLTQSGYPSDAATEDLERFFLDIREQLQLGSILRERSDNDDIFTLAN